ncbi:MAG TPA: hypothetical protein VM618_11380 [Acidimicrobiia bacterium]|nr:hypothetical protein [Acidimicrobiia bacterium]
MRRLLAFVVRLAFLAALGYAAYRLISGDESTVSSGSNGHGAAPGRAPAKRAGAGRSPGGTRRPPTAPATGPAPAPGRVIDIRPEGTGTAPQPPTSEVGAAWVTPDENGACPVSHPIKAKIDSGIYHRPEGRHYERTKADRCYRDAVAAEADGLRGSKQ